MAATKLGMAGCCGGGGGGSGPGGGIPYLLCACATLPATLAVTSEDNTIDFGFYQACGIAYGPVPVAFAGADIGVTGWYSTSTMTQSLTGGQFIYYLTCSSNQILLNLVSVPNEDGSIDFFETQFSWLIGADGNTCSPFSMTNGVPLDGTLAANFMTISG
jgi:hypothetical protein